MNWLQQPPPDTLSYMIAGYSVIFSVMFIYVIGLYIRQKNLKQDLDSLKELESQPHQSR